MLVLVLVLMALSLGLSNFAAAMAGCCRSIRTCPGQWSTCDGGGVFALFTMALSSLVYGLIKSNQHSFTDGLVLGCLAAAALASGISSTFRQVGIATGISGGPVERNGDAGSGDGAWPAVSRPGGRRARSPTCPGRVPRPGW